VARRLAAEPIEAGLMDVAKAKRAPGSTAVASWRRSPRHAAIPLVASGAVTAAEMDRCPSYV
jgi:hypothetical protein